MDLAIRIMGSAFVPMMLLAWSTVNRKNKLLRRCLNHLGDQPLDNLVDPSFDLMFQIERELGDL